MLSFPVELSDETTLVTRQRQTKFFLDFTQGGFETRFAGLDGSL